MDLLGTFRKAKASILHGAGHALRFKGDAYNSFADSIDMFADGVNPRQRPRPSRVKMIYYILNLRNRVMKIELFSFIVIK